MRVTVRGRPRPGHATFRLAASQDLARGITGRSADRFQRRAKG